MKTASQIEPTHRISSSYQPVGPMREIRESFGIRMADTARAMGLARSTVLGYETGEVSPALKRALLLARFYETTVEELFGYLIEEEEDDR